MCDKTTDVSNKEQAVIFIRTVNQKFDVREDFVGLHQLDCTKSEFVFNMLKDVLLRLNLSMSKMRGQCYDGAANMSGRVHNAVEFDAH